MADFDFPADLIELERSAREAHQEGRLTVGQAAAVQERVTAFATEAQASRVTVEMALKKIVRHAEPAEG